MRYKAYRHHSEKGGCGGVAFLYQADQIVMGAPLASTYARTPDGRTIGYCEIIVCGSCGQHLRTPPRYDVSTRDFLSEDVHLEDASGEETDVGRHPLDGEGVGGN